MKIAMATDIVGKTIKHEVQNLIEGKGHEIKDFGTCCEEDGEPFSDFVTPAIFSVIRGECDRGIFIDGEKVFSAYTANKIYRLYAAICRDPFYFKISREYSDYDILCINATIGTKFSLEIVNMWLDTELLQR